MCRKTGKQWNEGKDWKEMKCMRGEGRTQTEKQHNVDKGREAFGERHRQLNITS